jgi:hypothetical protein
LEVDDPRAHFNLRVTAVTPETTRPSAKLVGTPAKSEDTVCLSSDLRLANEAVRAAALPGDVRPEAVATALALMASGELGTDLERLAERIIESLTESRDG